MSYTRLTDETHARGNGLRKLYIIFFGGILLAFWLLICLVWNDDTPANGSRVFPIKNEQPEGRDGEKKFDLNLMDNFLIRQPGCRIPSMSVMGPMVEPYVKKKAAVHCDIPDGGKKKRTFKRRPMLVYDSKDALVVNLTALKYCGKKQIQCSYRSFRRASPSSNKKFPDNEPAEFAADAKYLNMTGETKIQSESDEFVKVVCFDSMPSKKKRKKAAKNPFYEDYFAFVPLKETVEDRCRKIDAQSDNENWMNVAVVGLDALSRLNFQRQMPSAYAYLREQMGAIEMFGFNKVGDNTFPNLTPTLMNLSEHEVQKVCWPKEKSVFDSCPFVWNEFRDKGYRTAFVEDTPFISVYNYEKKGFRRQPTDYYTRTMFYQSESAIGHHFNLNCYLCLGARLSLSVVLNYALKFVRTFYDKKFFGFFWSTSFTHDSMNLPAQGDEAVLQFLRQLRETALLNRTVLVVLSDHGLRWGSYRETFQGHLEERLPLLAFVFPSWFEKRYAEAVRNLRQNAYKLTTHYDLHATMVDLLNLTALENAAVVERGQPEATLRGVSLFAPVPANRSCSSAGIPKHYCTCHDRIGKLSVDDTRAVKAAAIVADRINQLLSTHPYCATLGVRSIKEATVEQSTMSGMFSAANGTVQYLVTVEMHPGNGLFEASIRHDRRSDTFAVLGRISRINLYGDQSFCVDNAVLKLYCFCKH